MQNKRIEYIDIAKGIGILIVLVDHIIGLYGKTGFPGEMGMNMFKLPLFFFISGMFFPSDLELNTFLSKKYKKLLLPFSFFFLISICIIPFLLSKGIGLKLFHYYGISFHNLFVIPFMEEDSTNGPMWFVWCLIVINIFYYIICVIAEHTNIKYMRQWLSLLMGGAGLFLASYGINIPGHIDSAMTAIVFFSVGDMLYHHTDIFHGEKPVPNRDLLISALTLLLICVFAYYVNYRINSFQSFGYMLAYPFGLAGTLSVIVLSKKLLGGGKNLITILLRLCGRYSLVLLCTHMQIMQVVGYVFDDILNLYGWYGICVNTVITLLCCVGICWLSKRYIPRMIGM